MIDYTICCCRPTAGIAGGTHKCAATHPTVHRGAAHQGLPQEGGGQAVDEECDGHRVSPEQGCQALPQQLTVLGSCVGPVQPVPPGMQPSILQLSLLCCCCCCCSCCCCCHCLAVVAVIKAAPIAVAVAAVAAAVLMTAPVAVAVTALLWLLLLSLLLLRLLLLPLLCCSCQYCSAFFC